jgi:glycosyltransferase EpsF
VHNRVVHAHNTDPSLPTSSRAKRLMGGAVLREFAIGMADKCVGVSQPALEALLNRRRPDAQRDHVVHCAIDSDAFVDDDTRVVIRSELAIPIDAPVLLFAGRMTEYKNPLFLIGVLEALTRLAPSAVLIFAGAGPLEARVRKAAEMSSISGNVRVLGFRSDIAALMQAADILLWPSLEHPQEGLGLGVVEGQAAGLQVIMSGAVPDEAIVVPHIVHRCSLAEGTTGWARQVAEVLAAGVVTHRRTYHTEIQRSSFGLENGLRNLLALYA